jgi:four helix bundle protein
MKHNNKDKFDLEDRLVDFAVMILDLTEKLPNNYGANHLARQITRSGTSPALLYGEAQGAESNADFVHKMKIALKELRETFICLKIIFKKKILTAKDIKKAADENNELISIFVTSIKTATINKKIKS